jgi:L,D-transpeptidase ErfK/SrfK
MNKQIGKALSIFFLMVSGNAFATGYIIPPSNESLVGQNKFTTTGYGETVVNLQQRYNIGYNAIESANPQLDLTKGFPANAPLQIPTQHLLPNQPRQGIVINLPEMRMYYYPAGTNRVLTYPIGIGKIGKTIPITMTSITRKTKDPVWIPPEDIREFNLQQGVVLPSVMPPGPDNPLGPYAIYMRVPTYLIHSTIFPESIGKRASFGCIRMYESDIQEFFPSVRGGIPVAIVNSPVKVGWQQNNMYIEAYRPLEEHGDAYDASLAGIVHSITTATNNHPTLVDWQEVAFIAQERDGVPHDVGIKLP